MQSLDIATGDGTRLHCLRAGQGAPLVLVPGWSQTAAQWKHQLAAFGGTHDVLAIDMRGHGESDRPDHGYRIARLAADLHDVLVALDLNDVTLAGHSMGCSVIWSYLELFGADRLRALVLTDQMPAIVRDPGWDEAQARDAGAILSAEQILPLGAALAGPDGAATTAAFLRTMVSPSFPEQEFAWMLAQNLKLPRRHAAALLFDHAFKDWRDQIRRIALPTLAVGGRISNVPWPAMEWIGRTIQGARTAILSAEERGSHFMFLENPGRYNELLRDFLARS